MDVKIIIEKSKDSYSAYAENVKGIYGMGDTLEEVKSSVLEAIEIMKDFEPKLNKNINIQYSYDTQSFLEFYDKVFTRAALSRLTGINERQLGHYIQGLHKPRKDKIVKIQDALHDLGKDLLSVELI